MCLTDIFTDLFHQIRNQYGLFKQVGSIPYIYIGTFPLVTIRFRRITAVTDRIFTPIDQNIRTHIQACAGTGQREIKLIGKQFELPGTLKKRRLRIFILRKQTQILLTRAKQYTCQQKTY